MKEFKTSLEKGLAPDDAFAQDARDFVDKLEHSLGTHTNVSALGMTIGLTQAVVGDHALLESGFATVIGGGQFGFPNGLTGGMFDGLGDYINPAKAKNWLVNHGHPEAASWSADKITDFFNDGNWSWSKNPSAVFGAVDLPHFIQSFATAVPKATLIDAAVLAVTEGATRATYHEHQNILTRAQTQEKVDEAAVEAKRLEALGDIKLGDNGFLSSEKSETSEVGKALKTFEAGQKAFKQKKSEERAFARVDLWGKQKIAGRHLWHGVSESRRNGNVLAMIPTTIWSGLSWVGETTFSALSTIATGGDKAAKAIVTAEKETHEQRDINAQILNGTTAAGEVNPESSKALNKLALNSDAVHKNLKKLAHEASYKHLDSYIEHLEKQYEDLAKDPVSHDDVESGSVDSCDEESHVDLSKVRLKAKNVRESFDNFAFATTMRFGNAFRSLANVFSPLTGQKFDYKTVEFVDADTLEAMKKKHFEKEKSSYCKERS